MKKYVSLILAAAFSVSFSAYAVDFDNGSGTDGALETLKGFGAGQQHGGDLPQPGHPQPSQPGNHGNDNNHPGNHDNNDNHPGNDHGGDWNNHPGNDHGSDWNNHPGNDNNHPGNHDNNDNHPGNDHGGDWNNHPGNFHDIDWNNHHGNDHGGDWDNHHNQPYSPVYPDMNCRIWEFTARTINTRTEEFSGEEQDDCYTENGQTYCRPTGNSFSRKITVNIGARQLESWEKESLKVCLDSEFAPRVDTSGMLYYYTVGSQNNDGFFGARSTVFTLTPGAKKPSNPDSKELSMTFAGITTSGDVHMTLTDNRADYFKGEKITITADGINIPDINSNAPVGDIIDSFVKFNVTNTFDVAGSYDIKLMDVPKPGKYMVTLTFSRTGPNSSGATASTIESFELK